MILEKIKERNKIRSEIVEGHHFSQAFVLISESIDDYLEYRIQADKNLEGILTDINNSINYLAERHWASSR